MLELMLVSELDKEEQSTGGENFGVMDMAYELKEKVRGLRTARKSPTSLWVYRPQDTYAMGWITYDNLMDMGGADQRYSVFSPNIMNNKYKWGDREHMASALSRAKAVKNAEKYLRPLTVVQTLSQVQEGFKQNLNKASQEMGKELRRLAFELREGFFEQTFRNNPPSAVENELKYLLDSGYVFINKELEQTLRKAFAAKEEFSEGRTLVDKGSHTFIEAYQVGGRQCFRGYDNVTSSKHFLQGNDDQMLRYTQEDLPEHIMGAISVLSMVVVGQYVVGVGYRAAENMFYVKCVGDTL